MPHLVSPLLPTSPKPSSKSEGLPSIPRAPDEASRDQNLTLRLLPVVPPTRVLIQPQPLCPGEERSQPPGWDHHPHLTVECFQKYSTSSTFSSECNRNLSRHSCSSMVMVLSRVYAVQDFLCLLQLDGNAQGLETLLDLRDVEMIILISVQTGTEVEGVVPAPAGRG